jgi:hypothetical protein
VFGPIGVRIVRYAGNGQGEAQHHRHGARHHASTLRTAGAVGCVDHGIPSTVDVTKTVAEPCDPAPALSTL